MYVFAILGLFYFKSPSKLSLTHSETQTHTFCLFLSFSFLTFALMEPESLVTHVRGIWIQNLLFHPSMFYQLNLNHLATPHNFFSFSFSFKNMFLLLRFLEQIPWSERGVSISFIIFIYHMIRDTFFHLLISSRSTLYVLPQNVLSRSTLYTHL